MLRKKYNLKKLKEEIEFLISTGRKTVNILELLTEIGFDPRDIASIYKDLINGRENFMKGK